MGKLTNWYHFAAIASEGQEIYELAILNAAMLPQIGKLRRSHKKSIEISMANHKLHGKEREMDEDLGLKTFAPSRSLFIIKLRTLERVGS